MHEWQEFRVFLIVSRVRRILEYKELKPGVNAEMNPITLSVGHSAALSIVYLDQNGNPMLAAPTPDSPPTWSNTTPATATLTEGPGNLTATEAAIAAGSDVVNLAVVVGGKSFSASLGVTVAAAPQVLTSVSIAAIVS